MKEPNKQRKPISELTERSFLIYGCTCLENQIGIKFYGLTKLPSVTQNLAPHAHPFTRIIAAA
jgi:hypothetical protein